MSAGCFGAPRPKLIPMQPSPSAETSGPCFPSLRIFITTSSSLVDPRRLRRTRALNGEGGEGDPALSLGIPTEQFRTSYSFLAPDTYTRSFVNITAASGQNVILDGSPVGGWTPVGGTGMQTTRVMIGGGAHTISSDLPFGIVVYGFGSYTSYMYPGGLDLEFINPLI